MKRFIKPALCGLLALVLTLSAFPGTAPQAQAASSSAIKNEINDLKAERNELKKQMASINQDLSANLDQIQQMVEEKNVIDQEIGLLEQEIQLISDQIQAYGLLIADKQDELDAAQAALDALSQKNKERIRAMEEDGTLSYWSVLFRANDFADLLDRLNMVEEIAAADRRRLDEMRAAKQLVEQAQAELTAEKASMEQTRLELEESQTLLAQKRVEADTKLAELNARKDEYLALLAEAEDADNALMEELAQKNKEYNAAKAAEEAAARPPAVTSSGKPPASVTNGITWVMPCNYSRFSSAYGMRIHPVYGYAKFHAGVDLGAAQGTPIVATRSGTVIAAQFNNTSGYYVSINHGDGFSSVYLHMTHFVVKAGQKVSAGQVIGYVGSTGVSTGPHLHFGISYDGVTQNPADYLNFY